MSIFTEDFEGQKLICKFSDELKDEYYYTDSQFTVIVKRDDTDKFESGLVAVVSGKDENDEEFYDECDGEDIMKKFIFGAWEIMSRKRI